MGSKYQSQAASGYAASSPPDDGTVSEANKVKFSTIRSKLTDVLKTFAEAINTALVTALDQSCRTVSASDSAAATDHNRTIQVTTSSVTITLADATTMAAGYIVSIANQSSGNISVALATSTDTIDTVTNAAPALAPYETRRYIVNAAATGYITASSSGVPTGTVMDYGGSTAPGGWLECDGSAVSRSTYPNLFAILSTTWGSGNGSTTFNLPDFKGRVRIGKGTGTVAEDVTASSSNGFTVSSNNTKWITGMTVVLSNLTGFTTTATAGPTYYAVRVSATNVRLATTLALAQAGSPDITLSGTGTATLTHTFTARTLGEYGGEESHAESISEMLAHSHPGSTFNGGIVGGGNQPAFDATATNLTDSVSVASQGGNAAMNIMGPFGVTMAIIKT
jgi:microcystin-dependent protein